MSRYFFPTASNVVLFLNGYHVDLLVGAEIEATENVVPVYGYNSRTPGVIAPGRSLIRGALYVQFANPTYMNRAFEGNANRDQDGPGSYRLYPLSQGDGSAQEDYGDYIRKIRSGIASSRETGTPAELKARAEYIATLLEKRPREKAVAKDTLYNMFSSGGMDAPSSDPKPNSSWRVEGRLPSKNNADRLGATMDIYYGNPENSLWFCRVHNVHPVRVSHRFFQSPDPSSSGSIVEVYDFVATHMVSQTKTLN